MSPLSVAPMMKYTDRHCRYLLRLITKQTLLYTEMVTTHAILRGNRDEHLCINPVESPVALQLGGSNPEQLAECVSIAADYGYAEFNLNVGCPSDRVQAGRFGLCLMKEPNLVADCVVAMRDQTDLPVTVKTRLGVDDLDNYSYLSNFVDIVSQAGCGQFIIHARKGWLKGLSPKENRTIPPLDYARVYQLKQDFPHLFIAINGGVTSLTQAQQHLKHVDSVMLGRAAYHDPYLLAEADRLFFGRNMPVPTREMVLEQYLAYLKSQGAGGYLLRHVLGLYRGTPGGKRWRRNLGRDLCHDDTL